MLYPKYQNDDYIDFKDDASAISFGWSFQVHAGIFLFLYYIKEFESIKIESSLQDIEILLKDGTKILAQAKSTQDPSSAKDKKERLKDAFVSLAKTCSITDSPVYVSNIIKTFDDDNGETDNTVASFSKCNQKVQEEIKQIFEATKKSVLNKKEKMKLEGKNTKKIEGVLHKLDDFDVTKMNFSFITSYSTNLDTRYSTIENRIIMCLSNEFKINNTKAIAIFKKLFDHWRLRFNDDSTIPDSNIKKTLKKKDIIWPIIIFLDDSNDYDPIISKIMTKSMDISMKNDAKRILDSVESVYHERFSFSNKVLHAYFEYKESNTTMENIELEFVKEKWQIFSEEFQTNDELENEYLTKMFMYKILVNNLEVVKVNKFVGEF